MSFKMINAHHGQTRTQCQSLCQINTHHQGSCQPWALFDSDGIDVIRALKADAELSKTPVMLVTNFAEHQQLAVAAGAVEGFGKQSLRDPATREKLAALEKRLADLEGRA